MSRRLLCPCLRPREGHKSLQTHTDTNERVRPVPVAQLWFLLSDKGEGTTAVNGVATHPVGSGSNSATLAGLLKLQAEGPCSPRVSVSSAAKQRAFGPSE